MAYVPEGPRPFIQRGAGKAVLVLQQDFGAGVVQRPPRDPAPRHPFVFDRQRYPHSPTKYTLAASPV